MPASGCYDHPVSIVSECTIIPDSDSTIAFLRLSISDLPMLTFQYIQKGCLFSGAHPPSLLSLLKLSLSKDLSAFPALAGRLSTHPATGHISISCSDAGALFVHAQAPSLFLSHILDPSDVPTLVNEFFPLGNTLSYDGHSAPLVAVQVTELGDAVFLGCAVNHAVVDGTSYWNFFNTIAEISSGVTKASRQPSFPRDDCVFFGDATLRFPSGRPAATFSGDEPTRERIFHFRSQAVVAVKNRANNDSLKLANTNDYIISSFQSMFAQLWRSVTRARSLPPAKTTTFTMPVNCRSRVNPKMDPLYFGNAIQIIKTAASAGEVVSSEIGWSGVLLRRSVSSQDDRAIREGVEAWERDPRCFPLGNYDGATIIIGSSPRFGMYDNDFGWRRPVAVRSGKANKFDGRRFRGGRGGRQLGLGGGSSAGHNGRFGKGSRVYAIRRLISWLAGNNKYIT